jgi:hypothetical protein
MKSNRLLISGSQDDEETPQQRAQRILAESIAFRTSLVSDIHAEIRVMCWEGWDRFCFQRTMMKVRDDNRTIRVVDRAGFMSQPGGSKQYISSIQGRD